MIKDWSAKGIFRIFPFTVFALCNVLHKHNLTSECLENVTSNPDEALNLKTEDVINVLSRQGYYTLQGAMME
jgi:hypothetical protein